MARFGRLRPARQTSTPSAGANHAAADALGGAAPVIEVLDAQLRDVVDLTEGAAFDLMTEASRADTEAASLAGVVRGLVASSARSAEEVMGLAESNSRAVAELERFVTERDEAVLALVDEVRQLDRHVEAIGEIARATTILALNAKIEAVRAGAAGAGFSVVADEVRGLSGKSAAAAEDVRSGITRVTDLLQERVGSTAERMSDQLRQVSGAQEQLRDELGATVLGLHDAIADVESGLGSLNVSTSAVMGHAQFQDITRQAVEAVLGGLGALGDRITEVAACLRERGDEETLRRLDDSLADLRESYVMARQRRVHAAVSGAGAADGGADEGPAIELF